jgi:D-lyxose ketol-isomerase
MKRSEVNAFMREGIAFLAKKQFLLPSFAFWTPEAWRAKGSECREIVTNQLGWDITDFGSGNFLKTGLFLFTIRNGSSADLANPATKTYAEKIMIVREGQVTPTHFHSQKMEDIINRGGGNLVIRLWNAKANDELDDTAVTVSVDGVRKTIPAGETLTLHPGDSVCLPQRNYHSFWGEAGKGTVLVGEVSRVNDDRTDNRFHAPIGRFPQIQEDEQPLHLLCTDYAKYYTAALAKPPLG